MVVTPKVVFKYKAQRLNSYRNLRDMARFWIVVIFIVDAETNDLTILFAPSETLNHCLVRIRIRFRTWQ
ncbi:hypothetical protein GBA52_018681 [Prunus armeniaca]|nr:hypothetical protein GBA52_018681 [Prunus armeniaca]